MRCALAASIWCRGREERKGVESEVVREGRGRAQGLRSEEFASIPAGCSAKRGVPFVKGFDVDSATYTTCFRTEQLTQHLRDLHLIGALENLSRDCELDDPFLVSTAGSREHLFDHASS